MKKAIFYTAVALFFVSLGTSFILNKYVAHHTLDSDRQDEGEDAQEYYKWQLKRLADPATGRIPDNIRVTELAYASTLPSDENLPNDRVMSSNWSSRGCWNIGGRTRAFAADISNEGTLLAGSCSGGMWRSTDTGKSWTMVTPLAIEQGVSCLAQDVRPGHTNVWYYGSGEAFGASASGGGNNAYFFGSGAYRSLDNGVTWKPLPKTTNTSNEFSTPWQFIWNMAIDPTALNNQSIVYAAAIGTLYRSVDTGNTWTTVLGGDLSDFSYFGDVQVSDSGIVYATLSSEGSQPGIWRSPDGITYTNIIPAGFPTTYKRVVIGISHKDPKQVYFLVNTSTGFGIPDTNFLGQVEWNALWKYKYISGDGSGAGGIWYDLSANLPSRGGLFDKYNSQGSYDMVIRVLPTDTSTVFIGGTDVFRSTTGFFDTSHSVHIGGYGVGTTLPDIKRYPNHHPDQHVIFFSSNNAYRMYSGCDGGIFKTYNDTAKNVSWTPLNNGYITTMFYAVSSDHNRPGGNVLIAGAQDNNSVFDNSLLQTNPWTIPLFGDGAYCYIEDSSKVFYYSSEQGKMFKMQMDTVTGTVSGFRRIDPIGAKGYEFVNPYVIDPNNNYIMYMSAGKYLWRNNNLSVIPFTNLPSSSNIFTCTSSSPGKAKLIEALLTKGLG